jgi:hypothetical protein
MERMERITPAALRRRRDASLNPQNTRVMA